MVNMNSVRKNVNIIKTQINASTIMIRHESYTLGAVIHLSLVITNVHKTIIS